MVPPPKIALGLKIQLTEPQEEEQEGPVSPGGTFRQGKYAVTSSGLAVNTLSLPTAYSGGTIEYEDLSLCQEDLGQGASGVVRKATVRDTNQVVALKVIHVFDEEKRKQIVKELDALYKSNSPYLVRFFGAFFQEGIISLALEYMDCGSLQDLINRSTRIPERIIGMIAFQCLRGLHYLHTEKRVVHRDIKPSNILVNSKGQIKITDFGVSAEMGGTLNLETFTGTIIYMSPERITCAKYTTKADIWSLGLTLMEAATGIFPYKTKFLKTIFPDVESGSAEGSSSRQEPSLPPLVVEGESGVMEVEDVRKLPGLQTICPSVQNLGFWEMLLNIQKYPPPILPPDGGFSQEFQDFLAACLQKDPEERMSAADLLKHPFILQHECTGPFNLEIAQYLADLGMGIGAVSGENSLNVGGADAGALAGSGGGSSSSGQLSTPKDVEGLLESVLRGVDGIVVRSSSLQDRDGRPVDSHRSSKSSKHSSSSSRRHDSTSSGKRHSSSSHHSGSSKDRDRKSPRQ